MENNMSDLLHDKKLRQQLIDNPRSTLEKINQHSIDGLDVKVIKNTKNITYIVMPGQFSESDVDLGSINAAGTSTAGTAGSVGSVGSICSTASSASSGGTIGCASSIEST